MPRRRQRLTALIASLLLVPSLATAGPGCLMGAGVAANDPAVAGVTAAEDHAAHRHASGALAASRTSHGVAVVTAPPDESGSSPPVGLPHAPAQCISVASCSVAAAPAAGAPLRVLPHVGERVAAGVLLAPDAPALALEPPPPRA